MDKQRGEDLNEFYLVSNEDEEGKEPVVDISKLYLGLETWDQYIDGQLCHVEDYQLYTMNGRLGDKFFLINMETADDITVDEDGNIIRYIPNEDKAELRDVTSVEDLYPLRETVDKLLKDTADFVQYMDGGQAGVEFFTKVKNHFDKCEKNGKTPYVDIPTFINILTCVSNVYVLCYGDKRFGLSQLECINEFRDERNGRRAI